MSVVERYWGGILQRLRAEVDVLSQLIEHRGEKGRANELALAQVLERFLPSRWSVGTGILIDSHGRSSRQMDIVIHETSDEPRVLAQTAQVLFPIETVVACVEVKTTLQTDDVVLDFAAKREALGALKSTTNQTPLFALLAYNCEPSPDTIARRLREQEVRGLAPDLACILNWCALAGSTEVLGSAGYIVGNCLLQRRGDDGGWDQAYVETESEGRAVVHDGALLPVIRRDGRRYVGDPGRALLLFMEGLARASAARRGTPPPTLSAYLSADARTLSEIGAS